MLIALRRQDLAERRGTLLVDGRGGHVRRIVQSAQFLKGGELPV
jgi:hypothetical protein